MRTIISAGAFLAAIIVAPVASAQLPGQEARDFMVLAGRGAEIGVQVVNGKDSGVLVEDVRANSPAEKAGVKRSDVITMFDGERVRSVRQFTRLVQETPPGRTVKATIVREGQQKDIQITPDEGRGMTSGGFVDRDRLPDLRMFDRRMPDFDVLPHVRPFDFDFALPGQMSSRRLGVEVHPLSDQLAHYFGVKEGVLVGSVADDSAASRAGLQAGDVITTIEAQPVRSREDLARALRDAKDGELTIGIVRDHKETTVKAKIEAPRRKR
jgi:serine protease Do